MLKKTEPQAKQHDSYMVKKSEESLYSPKEADCQFNKHRIWESSIVLEQNLMQLVVIQFREKIGEHIEEQKRKIQTVCLMLF